MFSYEELLIHIGISQRDTNYYEFWNDPETRSKAIAAVQEYWEQHIKDIWTAQQDCALFTSFFPDACLFTIRYI